MKHLSLWTSLAGLLAYVVAPSPASPKLPADRYHNGLSKARERARAAARARRHGPDNTERFKTDSYFSARQALHSQGGQP